MPSGEKRGAVGTKCHYPIRSSCHCSPRRTGLVNVLEKKNFFFVSQLLRYNSSENVNTVVSLWEQLKNLIFPSNYTFSIHILRPSTDFYFLDEIYLLY